MDPENDNTPSLSNETPLQGWKEIGAYLEREPRTARRWELEEELPIRRHRTDRRSSVYAYPSELEAWRASRPAQSAVNDAPDPSKPRLWIWAAIAAVFIVGALAILRQSRSLDTVAEAQGGEGGIRTTEVHSVAVYGELSPNGRYLSETDWPNSGEIGIRNLETNEYRRLGSKASWSEGAGEADKSIFSPDGKKIAYNWGSDRTGEFKYELRVIDAFGDSPQMRMVYFNPEFRYIEPSVWTGDNRLLVWFRRNDWSTGLGFVSIASGDLTVVRSFNGQVSAPVLSHDERWISYDIPEAEEAARDVFVLAADGTSEFRVTEHRANDFVMGFAPGDATLLFASNRTGSYGLWGQRLVDARPNDEPMLLMRDIGTVAPMSVEPDGSLVYVRAIGSVEILKAQIDINTGELISRPSVLDTQYQGSNEGAWLSPDGSRLAYKASPSRGVSALMVRDLSSGVDRQVDTGGLTPEVYYSVAWSPDGKRLLTAGRDDQKRWSLAEIDVDKGGAHAFRTGLGLPLRPIGWLADNKTILYVNEEGRTSDGLQVKTVEKLAPGRTDAEILYSSQGKGAANRILIAKLSPQRDRIAWRELSNPERIKVMSVDGGEPRVVLEATIDDPSGPADLSWAPDGKSLILVRQIIPNDPLRNDKLRQVWVVPLEGGPPRKTELSAKGLRRTELHPDGKTIFFQAGSADDRIFRTENYLPAHN